MTTTTQPNHVTTGPIIGSRKILSPTPCRPDILVPFREVALHPTALEPPLHLYDTSGPYTDPSIPINLNNGLPKPRAPWLAGRSFAAVTARAVQPADNGFVPAELLVPECHAPHNIFNGTQNRLVTQYEFARAGIITEEMIYVAHRENLGRTKSLHDAASRIADGESFGAAIPEFVTPEFVRAEIAISDAACGIMQTFGAA